MDKKTVEWANVVLMCAIWAIGFSAAYLISLTPVRIVIGKDAGQLWAAWVQAIGSIAAICVAIYIPFQIQKREHRLAERNRELRIRSHAIAFQPLIEDFRNNLASSLEAATDYDHPDGPRIEDAEKLCRPTDSLIARAAELHEIGQPAAGVILAISLAATVRQRLRYTETYNTHHGTTQPDGELVDMDPPEDYLEPLRWAKVEVEQSLNHIAHLIQ
ncbi:hypothetical protein [Stenotrophomonas geniculata]|uniref:hypothetical protein n=1 Tax=Stenotrophomonas geniculata TaxID=86188 RepID=UPI00122DEC4E|nr:hypothetical protein [Stenotrophomonas geniculata]